MAVRACCTLGFGEAPVQLKLVVWEERGRGMLVTVVADVAAADRGVGGRVLQTV